MIPEAVLGRDGSVVLDVSRVVQLEVPMSRLLPLAEEPSKVVHGSEAAGEFDVCCVV